MDFNELILYTFLLGSEALNDIVPYRTGLIHTPLSISQIYV